MKKKILVTGANGLLGKSLCDTLIQNDCEVYAIVRSKSDFITNSYLNYLSIDLDRKFSFNQFPKKLDAIYHLAQSEHFRNFPSKANNIFNVNVKSTQYLLDFAQKTKVKNFVYASSGGVYGFGEEAFDEDLTVPVNNNLGYYLGTKMMSELLVRNYSKYFITQIIRPFFIYGPRQKSDMLIPRLIGNVLNKRKIILQGEQGLSLNPIFVSDAANAIAKLAYINKSGMYNIAGNEIVTLKQLSQLIGDIFQTQPIFEINAEELPKSLVANINKLKLELVAPCISLEQGIESFKTSE